MRTAIETTINKHITSKAAQVVATEMTLALLNLERVARGDDMTPELRTDVARAFVTVFLDLPANPFWRDHAGYLTPIIATACNAWMDASAFAVRSQKEAERGNNDGSAEALVRGVGLRASIIEIALAVLYCERGAGGLRDASVRLRDDLLKVIEA